MLRIRLCEESFVDPILSGAIRCPVHLYSGEEAIAVGVGAALEKTDYVFGSHRSHGHYLAKGGSLDKLVAEVFCNEAGCSHGRGGSMHLVAPEYGMMGSAPIVAGTISLALGAALASSARRDQRVTVTFFGDGATGEGVLYESLNFAALNRLPIIFACENNLYSTHLPIDECRVRRNISEIAAPFGIKSERIDGNDVLKTYETAKKAIRACRAGKGPYFIEFLTYRLRGHVGPNDNIQGTQTDIRPKKEVNYWTKRDPITGFERALLRSKIMMKSEIVQMRREVEQEIKKSHEFARSQELPRKEEASRYVFK